jgi:hypothetical protein
LHLSSPATVSTTTLLVFKAQTTIYKHLKVLKRVIRLGEDGNIITIDKKNTNLNDA